MLQLFICMLAFKVSLCSLGCHPAIILVINLVQVTVLLHRLVQSTDGTVDSGRCVCALVLCYMALGIRKGVRELAISNSMTIFGSVGSLRHRIWVVVLNAVGKNSIALGQ
ncbi:hypothetical protein BN1708_005219 [Verticillium longisporum]|uniref:Secreted protein n=1 Tax=Verticillium longisporum TaxID=100787 RepID=A0A0G4M9E5_VERLO|nr:hypothetical protein BN1708_005219 [Verticillium longisporum]